MTVRFLADEDLDVNLLQGLRSREPAIDILDVKTVGLRRTRDQDLLELASDQSRILIAYDRTTMARHFRDRLDAGKPGSGASILPQQQAAIGEIIESLSMRHRNGTGGTGSTASCCCQAFYDRIPTGISRRKVQSGFSL